MNNYVLPVLGKIKLCSLTKLQIQQYTDDLTRETDSHKAYAPKTVRSVHGALSKCLETAFQMELIVKNPASKIMLPKLKTKEITVLTHEQLSALLKLLDQRKYGNELKIILFSGVRESELLGIKWNYVDFANSTMTIKAQLQKRNDGSYDFVEDTKSHKQRTITLAASVMKLFKEIKNEQTKNRLAAGIAWEGLGKHI